MNSYIRSSDYEDSGVSDAQRSNSRRGQSNDAGPSTIGADAAAFISPSGAPVDATTDGDNGMEQIHGSSEEMEAETMRGMRKQSADGKVGMAVIFNKVPADGGSASWDYTLRFNASYGVSQFDHQVCQSCGA